MCEKGWKGVPDPTGCTDDRLSDTDDTTTAGGHDKEVGEETQYPERGTSIVTGSLGPDLWCKRTRVTIEVLSIYYVRPG